MDSEASFAGLEENSSPSIVIPDHTLVRCIGRGSYGEVWLARNMMGSFRAVKIVYRKSFRDQRPFERELSGIRRFEPISRSYEGFVDVLHVGINDERGYFYYLMELGDDQSSGQKINPKNYSPKTLAGEMSARGKLPFQECLQLGLALTHALNELHKHGLVHRDVKPSNIIFVNGAPKLADIGLVADIKEALSYVGTEGFIPPEGPGSLQADVYSLGKVLYEASTGKDRHQFPDLPTHLEEFLKDEGFLELNEVILHACNNDVRKRYQSARDMHADLQLLAAGKSVRRLKLLERRLTRLKQAAVVVTLAVAMAGVIAYQFYREWKNSVELHQRQIGENVAYGNRAVEAGDFFGALPYFAETLFLDKDNPRQESSHWLQFNSTLAQCPKLIQLWFFTNEVRDAEFSPDGKNMLITEFSGKASLCDIESGKLISKPFGQGADLWNSTFSPDAKFILTTSEENHSVSIWDSSGAKELKRLMHPDKVFNARFSPDGLRIVTCCKDGIARVWNARTGRLELSLEGHSKTVRFAAFSNDGSYIVTAGQDGTARIWNSKNGQPVKLPFPHDNWVNYAVFSPDNKKIVTADSDHKARIWDITTGEKILTDLNHDDGVESAEFSPDGRMIVTASLDGTARLWRLNDSELRGFILQHTAGVTHASFSRDGHRIVTACTDGSVRVWDLAGAVTPPIVQKYIYSPDASRFLVVSNGFFQTRDAATGKPVSPLTAPAFSFDQIKFSRNGRFVIGVSANPPHPLVQVWNSLTGKPVSSPLLLSNSIADFSLSDSGKYVVTFGGQVARIWDMFSGSNICLPHGNLITSAQFSPDENYLATSAGTNLCVWKVADGRMAFPPLSHQHLVSCVSFSPDGSRLVTGCSDYQVHKCYAQIWNLKTGQPIGPKLNHSDGVLHASFSPDGRRLVTASEDYTAIIWSAVTGAQLAPPLRHADKVRTAVFSSNGKWIVTASVDKTARVWNAETGDPLTPPLRQLVPLTGAKFIDDDRIVAFDENGNAATWRLPVKDISVEDAENLAYLLDGSAISGHSPAPQSESIQNAWQSLRHKYPSAFQVSPEKVAAWYLFQDGENEAARQWPAAVFYSKRLLEIQPQPGNWSSASPK